MESTVKHYRFVLAAVAAATLATSPTSLAKLYKWVDAQGNVTYSELAPPEGQTAEELELHGYRSADPNADESLEQLKDKADAARDDRKFAGSDSEAAKERDARIQQNCETARENLRILNSSARVQETDADGNPVYLDEAAVKAKIDTTQKQVKDNCG